MCSPQAVSFTLVFPWPILPSVCPILPFSSRSKFGPSADPSFDPVFSKSLSFASGTTSSHPCYFLTKPVPSFQSLISHTHTTMVTASCQLSLVATLHQLPPVISHCQSPPVATSRQLPPVAAICQSLPVAVPHQPLPVAIPRESPPVAIPCQSSPVVIPPLLRPLLDMNIGRSCPTE